MKCKITLQERLKDLSVAHNLNLEELAKLTGISKSALGNYENVDYKEINHGNLVILAQFYKVSTDYLLCLTENKNHPNTDLTNLHLSDNMIDLLTSINLLISISLIIPNPWQFLHIPSGLLKEYFIEYPMKGLASLE